MKAVWQKGLFGGLLAASSVPKLWAADQSTDSDSAVIAAGGGYMWVGVAALLLLGLGLVGWYRRSRSGDALFTARSEIEEDEQGVRASVLRSYSEKNVGNDASARPWERRGPALDAGTAAGSQGGWSVDADSAPRSAPDGFDAESFLSASKANFLALQEAWDKADVSQLRAMLTAGMLEQIKSQLAERETLGGVGTVTEVVLLEARLLGVEEQGEEQIASVEFSGMLREDPSAGPNPFRELWNITRPKGGDGGWLVAGVQALQ
ncbi:MAG: Tim44-like domain-containing protein [Burkholderiaceae bacterium]